MPNEEQQLSLNVTKDVIPRTKTKIQIKKKAATTEDLMLVPPGKRYVHRGTSWANDDTDRRFYPYATRRILKRVEMNYSFSNIASMVSN